MAAKVEWNKAVDPLIKNYKGRKHPLEYKNLYQLLVMVVLSGRDSDKHINQLAPAFFKQYPDMASLAKATPDEIFKHHNALNRAAKSKWLAEIAQKIKSDENIPLNLEELVKLPGIGRKTANVIMHEMHAKPEGVIVDLHVVRVANRLGITKSDKPEVIEEDIMKKVDQVKWGEVGMAISFLGRETCRPTDPHHEDCVMKGICQYYAKASKVKLKTKKKK